MMIEVLVSTMNIQDVKELKKLIKKMNINENSVIIINQCPDRKKELIQYENEKVKLLSYNDKGLSKSRNLAIENSQGDICVIADDDLTYCNDYEAKIKDAYNKYPDADIIAFYVESLNLDRQTSNQKEGRLSFLQSMKISSFQITFKRNSIVDNKIKFDINFGAGTNYFTAGEENIFLFDCLKKKLKLYYVPINIANVNHKNSTWFSEINEQYFITKGAVFYRMSKFLYIFLILQFAIRKRKLFKDKYDIKEATKLMLKGKNMSKGTKKGGG